MTTEEKIKYYVDVYDNLLDFPVYLGIIKPSIKIPDGRDFECCCPLHDENTPSFKYKEKLKKWRCFGKCNTGGQVTKFHYLYLKKQLGDISVIDSLRNLQMMFPHLPPIVLTTTKIHDENKIVRDIQEMINPSGIKAEDINVLDYKSDSEFFLRMFLFNVEEYKAQ